MPESSSALALYVHLPWCVRKCPYCDFNSHAVIGNPPFDAYTSALLKDLSVELDRSPDRPVESVFFGGGTPSLFPATSIARVLDTLGARLAPQAEVTLEANPGASEQQRFRDYRDAGVNRLSIGVQSFQTHLLHRLGRIHDADDARRAIDAAQGAGFDRFNVDLMFGLPGQSLEEALGDVETAIALGAPHVSHYQLTLEPNTVFYSKPPDLPDEERIWRMQMRCAEHLAAAGLERYEVSAWARPGQACRHNLNYWRYGDYLAIGAGAHGKLTTGNDILRYRKPRLPESYMRRSRLDDFDAAVWRVSESERPLEYLMNALRLTEGFTTSDYTMATGLPAAALADRLDTFVEDGLLRFDNARYQATGRGINYLDSILQAFLSEDSP